MPQYVMTFQAHPAIVKRVQLVVDMYSSIVYHTCAYARWAHKHCFVSGRLSVTKGSMNNDLGAEEKNENLFFS